MKTREQNRNNERTEIERFDWFIERTQTRVAFGKKKKKLHANQSKLRFDVILQPDWPIEQCLLHIRVFFGGKTKSPCFDLFRHPLADSDKTNNEHLANIFQGHTKIALSKRQR